MGQALEPSGQRLSPSARVLRFATSRRYRPAALEDVGVGGVIMQLLVGIVTVLPCSH
jgi:hypothetical protein